MKAKWKYFGSAFFLLSCTLTYVHIYITEAPIPYPIPEQCRRLSSSIYHYITEDAKQHIRKSVKQCFPQNFAFLVYKDTDVGTSNMKFKQGFSLAEYLTYPFTTGTGEYISKFNYDTINPQRDCAIIGNGGILEGSKCGKNINNHDFVFRSNLAPIESYEEDVGVKTNITVLNSQIIRQVLATIYPNNGSLGEKFLSRIKYLNDSILWYTKGAQVKYRSNGRILRLSRLLKNQYNLRIRFGFSWKSLPPLATWFWDLDVPHPTTGLITFTAAASMCDKIALYGFYPFHHDPVGKSIRYHYFDTTDVLQSKAHAMPVEYELLKKFNQSGLLSLVLDCGN